MSHLTDSATGITFPATLLNGEEAVTCMGVGVREKKIAMVSIKAYTVGLFVDASEARTKLAAFTPSAGLAKDEAYYSALLGLSKKYLHLVFARDVPKGKLLDAFSALTGVSKAVAEEFSATLGGALPSEVGKGHSITLGHAAEGKLVIMVDGTTVGEINDAALPNAVFAIFLGPKTVAPAMRTALATNLSAILATA